MKLVIHWYNLPPELRSALGITGTNNSTDISAKYAQTLVDAMKEDGAEFALMFLWLEWNTAMRSAFAIVLMQQDGEDQVHGAIVTGEKLIGLASTVSMFLVVDQGTDAVPTLDGPSTSVEPGWDGNGSSVP